MSSLANFKVRLVRCPKCRHLLRELVEVPIYSCGGCGAILVAKKPGKDLQGTGPQAHEANPNDKNKVQNTSENPITDGSCIDESYNGVDSAKDDRIELLGEINKSSQLYDSEAITCHEIKGSSADARARNEEEDGTVPLNQYGAADHNPYQDEDKHSENGASNEILPSSELNQMKSNSLVPQVHNHVSESLLSLETETQSRHSSSAYNCYGEEEVAKNDLGNATENPSAVIETESPPSSEDNCDGGKKEIENELQNTSEECSPDNTDLENVHAEGKSGADGRREWIGSVNPITCHEIAYLSLRCIAPAEADKCEVSFNQSGTEAHYESVYDNEKSGDVSISNKVLSRNEEEDGMMPLNQYGTADHNPYKDEAKNSENGASNEIFSSSEFNQKESNSLVPQVHNHESESLLSSLETETQSRHSSSEYNCDGEKEVAEYDLCNATENPSAVIETESPNSSEDNCDGGKKEIENELQNTSEECSPDNKDLENIHAEGKSGTDGRRELIGSVNPITCHEISDLSLICIAPAEADKCEVSFNQSGSEAHYKSVYDNEKSRDVSISNKVLARNEEEDDTVPLNQYGAADHNPYYDEAKDSENGASNEIMSSSELNQKESNSLVPQVHNYESESLLSSLETETQSRHSSSEYNCDGEKEAAEYDLCNATENPSAVIETESPNSSEDNCDGGKKEIENELQNTSEECSPDNKDLENIHAEGKSGADGRRELIGSVNPITCHEISDLSLICIAPAEADKCEVSFNQSGSEAHYKSVYDNEKSRDVSISNKVLARNEEEDDTVPLNQYGAADHNPYYDEAKDSENGASNEIMSSSELNQKESNSLVPQVHDHESDSILSSLETETQSRHSQLEYNCDGEKEVAENDLGNATENPSAVIETESPRSSEDNCDEGKKDFENELQNTSENFSPDNKDLENVHAEGKSGADGRRELIGSVNPITCHEISDLSLICIAPAEADKCEVSFNQSGSEAHYKSVYDNEKSRDVSISNKVLARNEEEDDTVPLNQYGAADHNPYYDEAKDSENGASNEIMSSSELNQKESNSLVPQVHDHESDSILSSLETETQSRHSQLEYNCDGEKEVAENDLGNATENPSAVIETESPRSSEDNCDEGKKDFENELQNTSENFSPDNKDLENVHAEGKSGADGRREWIGSVNPITCHEISDLSLGGIAPAEADKCEVSFNQSGSEAHYKSVYDNEKSRDVSISNKVLSSSKLNQLENDPSVPGYHMYGSSESLLSSPKKVTGSGCSSPNNDADGKNEHPSLVEEVDENRESLLILTSAESFPDTVTKDRISTTDTFSNKGISLDNLMSSHREMQQVEGGMVPGFQRINSDDSLENTSHFYARGDLGVTLRSSTARNYYAYDVSASGNESDDQVANRRFQKLKGSLKDVGPNSTKVLPERSEYVMNHVTSNAKLQRQLMDSRSSLQGKKHSTTKVSRWHQDELLERSRYRSPVRYRMRNETDDYHSRLLFPKYRFQADQGSSSSSNYGQKEFSALPDNPHELHRLELLRMVYELQDQLKKTQLSEGRPRGRILTISSRGKEHHFADNRKDYSDLAYHNYHEKYRRDITWLKNRELSQMVLPEDPIHYMHRVDCLCLRCCSHEQYHSAQKPPHAIRYSEEQSMTYALQTSRPYHSASSIAHQYATSKFSLRSQDMKPDDQWYNKHKEARIHHIAKQHFQPVAGGAPIIACYHCSEMLQIPAESLLFKRRCHQLKCGACSKVLKFSLENKIHVVRYDLIPRTPLPSVIAENTRVMKKSNLTLAHRGSDRPLAEPAASSDDSQSFSRSYSTGDNFSVIPGKFSSASSFKTPKEGTKSESTRASVYKNKSSVESFKSAVSSFNMLDSEHSSSESEVESPVPGSSLHKLMGYSSIRRLVFQ